MLCDNIADVIFDNQRAHNIIILDTNKNYTFLITRHKIKDIYTEVSWSMKITEQVNTANKPKEL